MDLMTVCSHKVSETVKGLGGIEGISMVAAWPSRVTCVLFDLDGTLIDSAAGITACLAKTVAAFGGPTLSPSALTSFVGPPVAETLRILTDIPHRRIPEAVEEYRALSLREGIALSTVFPRVHALLGALRELGVPLAVATSKRESHARAMLELHKLDEAFVAISGAAEDDTASEKEVVITSALARLAASGVDVSAPVLVGDRSFDVRGAAAVGIPALFAAWGYGDADEAEGAYSTATDPDHAWELLRQSLSAVGDRKDLQ